MAVRISVAPTSPRRLQPTIATLARAAAPPQSTPPVGYYRFGARHSLVFQVWRTALVGISGMAHGTRQGSSSSESADADGGRKPEQTCVGKTAMGPFGHSGYWMASHIGPVLLDGLSQRFGCRRAFGPRVTPTFSRAVPFAGVA